MPTAPRSSRWAHSMAMRRTTSSAVNIGAIRRFPDTWLCSELFVARIKTSTIRLMRQRNGIP
jgi:hypothetical protein